MASKIQHAIEKLKEKEAQSASQKSINKAVSKLHQKQQQESPFSMLETHLEKDKKNKSKLQRQLTLGVATVVILAISTYSYFSHQKKQEDLQTARSQILQFKSLAQQHAEDTGSFIQLTPQSLDSPLFDTKLPFGAIIQLQSNMDGSVVELLVKSSPKDACQNLSQSLFSEFDFVEVDQQRAASPDEAANFCTTTGQNSLGFYLVNRALPPSYTNTPQEGTAEPVDFLPLRPPIEPPSALEGGLTTPSGVGTAPSQIAPQLSGAN